MSPTPLRQCVFDQIVAGTLPAQIVLDEPGLLGFLDSRPVFAGHTLVVPRSHVATVAGVPAEELGPLLDAGRRVAAAQRSALGADGTLFLLNDVVSQSVPHVHLHVVPRRRGDGLRGFLWPRTRYRDDAEAAAVAAKLRAALPPPDGALPLATSPRK
ncbi:MAG: HIT family protein [Acidimicrobiales bacterium]